MTVSLDDAIAIHAKALRAGHGTRWAMRRAIAEAYRCRANGDLEGFEVWLKVRDAVRGDGEKTGDKDLD
ncbi:MAG: hypothetical protein JO252_22380 [Planctomycetaceae bacterium]|nr:hypothetical protein [Planctomycetaceae bacterium]